MKWLDKKDPDDNRIVELENSSITCYFYEQDNENGVIVDNHTNDVLTWNSVGVSHMNLQSKNFTVMITDDNQLTITYGENEEDTKNIVMDIDSLIELIKQKGKTLKELEEEKENGEQSEPEPESDT